MGVVLAARERYSEAVKGRERCSVELVQLP